MLTCRFIALALLVAGGVAAGCGGADPRRAELPPEVAQGEKLAATLGCASCHSVDGSRRTGPTWLGIWGEEVPLADGGTAVVDEVYIERSVRDPSAVIVDGYSNLMPTIDVTPDELSALTAYIRSLGTS